MKLYNPSEIKSSVYSELKALRWAATEVQNKMDHIQHPVVVVPFVSSCILCSDSTFRPERLQQRHLEKSVMENVIRGYLYHVFVHAGLK